jgi:hypothetical protein
MKTEDQDDENNFSKMPVVIPDQHYLAEQYLVKIPASDKRLKNKWELRKYAAKLVEQKIGDEIQLTAMKVKQPHILSKLKAHLFSREPQVRLYVTVKF